MSRMKRFLTSDPPDPFEPRVTGWIWRLVETYRAILVLMILVSLAGCSVVGIVPAVPVEGISTGPGQDIPADESGRYKYLEQSNTQTHQAGTVESVIEYGENSVLGVHYPVFGKEAIDSVTREFVEDIISGFMSEVEDFTAEHADLRAELNVDYETWLVEDRLVSIKFIILVNMPGYAHPEVTVETFVYDLETVQPVFLEDILVEGSLPKLAQLARDDLASNPDYAGYVDLDLFTTGTEPVYDNYRRFLLTQDHFTLLFQKYQVFPGAVGTPSVAIPYGRMEGIIDLPGPDSQAPQDPPNAMDYPRREPPPDIDGNCGPGSAGGHGIGEEAVRQIDPDKPMVALTFDDGPLSSTTGSILDTLKEHDSVATFFVIGNRAHHNAELLKRMVSEGHEIGNHSFNHKRLTTLSPEELQYQIERTQIAVKTVTGVEPLIMRPTYGSYNNQLEQNAGMPMIMWSVDTRDWESRDVESIIQQVMDHVQDGDIILMHDIYVPTAEAVKAVVPELISRGFQLVTVSELLAAKGISLEAGKVYRNGGNLQY